jgi:hypothetical protein
MQGCLLGVSVELIPTRQAWSMLDTHQTGSLLDAQVQLCGVQGPCLPGRYNRTYSPSRVHACRVGTIVPTRWAGSLLAG